MKTNINKKGQVDRIILNGFFLMIGFIVFIAGFQAWKPIINGFVAGSTNVGVSILVKLMPFAGFVFFIIAGFAIFLQRG